MGWCQRTGLATSVLLGLAAGGVAPAAGTAEAERPGDPPQTVIVQSASLSTHQAGFPAAGSAVQRRVARASVTMNYVSDTLDATVVMQASPTTATNAATQIGFGLLDGGACDTYSYFDFETAVTEPEVRRSGAAYTVHSVHPGDSISDGGWECVVVRTYNAVDGIGEYDVMAADLVDRRATPSLVLRNVPRPRLVRGVWTTIDVKVVNRGLGYSTAGVLTGRGRGLRVASTRVPRLSSGGSALVRTRVKLTGTRAQSSGTLSVRTSNASTRTALRVRRIPPPARPTPGLWKGPRNLRFRVTRNRTIVGFGIDAFFRCSSGPSATARVTLRKATVLRNGIVQKRGYLKSIQTSVYVDMKVVGSRATGFAYGDAGSCEAREKIRARRVRP